MPETRHPSGFPVELPQTKEEFVTNLRYYILNDYIFTETLLSALLSGYFNIAYIKALRYFGFEHFTSPPRRITDDYIAPAEQNLDIYLGDFKRDMINVVSAGIATEEEVYNSIISLLVVLGYGPFLQGLLH